MLGGIGEDAFQTVEIIVTQGMVGYIEIEECKYCGSLISDKEQHIRWHNLNRIGFG